MSFAMVPPGAAKPATKDTADMESAMGKVRSKLRAASGTS